MSSSDRDKWNDKYAQRDALHEITPDDWLVDALNHAGLNSEARRALDLACGLGHNSLWLAQQGWQVDGVDVSETGLRLAQHTATTHGCKVNWIAADLDDWLPPAHAYDLVIAFRFLDRETVPRIVNAGLRSGGILVYETFSAGQLERPDSHIRNPAFTLASGELRRMFPDCEVLIDREDILADRTVTRFLARRR